MCQRTKAMFGQGRKERTSLPVAGVLETCAKYPTAKRHGGSTRLTANDAIANIARRVIQWLRHMAW